LLNSQDSYIKKLYTWFLLPYASIPMDNLNKKDFFTLRKNILTIW
jgi:hypothetical protein